MTQDYAQRKSAKARSKKRSREDQDGQPRKKRKHRKVTEAICYHPPVITADDLEWPEDEGGPGNLSKSGLGTAIHLLDPALLEQQNRAKKRTQVRQKRKAHAAAKAQPDGELPLHKYGSLVAAYMAKRGFGEATEVQEGVWSDDVRGRDVIATAPTGGGKTLAYVLGAAKEIEV